jgi:hypothetical protein
MRNQFMTMDEELEFHDRIVEARWEARQAGIARRRAAVARRAASLRAIPTSFGLHMQARNQV